ncbi:MAG: hypothetical protein FRX49_04595 [Trebouxia sp. A1-2]|nr:MAG: hypothetical protein FRX49_04595 [Trebouxia sp. A1-2]
MNDQLNVKVPLMNGTSAQKTQQAQLPHKQAGNQSYLANLWLLKTPSTAPQSDTTTPGKQIWAGTCGEAIHGVVGAHNALCMAFRHTSLKGRQVLSPPWIPLTKLTPIREDTSCALGHSITKDLLPQFKSTHRIQQQAAHH